MQDRYVGDVGDFGKYGLLRSLRRGDEHGATLRLGVIWYRFDGDDSAAPNDGRHTDYLFAPSRHERLLRRCDHELFEKLLHLVNNDRSIAAVEASDVLPADTVFFREGLSFKETPRGERDGKRHRWFNAGLRRVKEAEVVFFDPDNGLQVPSRSSMSLMGPKYVYYDDLYFVLPRPEHAGRLKSRIDGFLDSSWGEGSSPHFELVHC